MKFTRRNSLIATTAIALLSVGVLVGQAAPTGPDKHIALFRHILSLVNDFTATAEKPSAAAVAAIMGLEDHIPDPAKRIAYLEQRLPRVSDPVVQRAIRFTLADLYKKTGNSEKALEQLNSLIVNRPQAD